MAAGLITLAAGIGVLVAVVLVLAAWGNRWLPPRLLPAGGRVDRARAAE